MFFLEFIKQFLSTPAFVVGIFTLIGAVVLRKSFSQILISSFKVTIGFLILGGGAGVLVGSLGKFQSVFEYTYGLKGVIPNNDGFAGVLTNVSDIANVGSLIMIVGMILNLILAATSRFKYVYLSGHVLFYTSLMIAAVFITLGFDPKQTADFFLILFSGAALLASYMVISPALQQRHMNMIIGTNEIGLGHTGGFGYALSGYIGEGIGKLMKGKVLSTESIKFPKSLYFFRNSLVSLSITILIFYMFAFLPGGIKYQLNAAKWAEALGGAEKDAFLAAQGDTFLPYYETISGGNWLVTMFVQAFTFTAGVEIMLSGVRLFIGELVPTFKAFSDKLIKNSKAAVDCPVVFPYAPNAVLIGFISSFAAGLIGMAITIGLNKVSSSILIILPGLVPHFFLGATSGVFGNVKGGIVGAIVGPFVHGLIITIVPLIFLLGNWVPATSEVLKALVPAKEQDGISSLNWGDTDYIIGAVPGLLGKINKWAGMIAPFVIYLGLMVDGFISKLFKKNKEVKVA
ncbi:PTS ascorbate transporter subunit IIC [Mycoplasmopsis pullorum]|uniref:PTS ascorbate transporter subunit IIC n=2 Tax=Mycoplasmopsis pullorum TaxID=48003 RepID=UPI001F1C98D8|nr:PTS ascorbate transporter subunit IIC [Mycoplasmopsis pullorum]